EPSSSSVSASSSASPPASRPDRASGSAATDREVPIPRVGRDAGSVVATPSAAPETAAVPHVASVECVAVDSLDAYFGASRVVRDVSFGVRGGEVTAIIGPSGCGKSTLLRCLNRMHETVPGARVEGRVLLDGEDIYAPDVDPVAVRRRVGMVFQRANPFPTMSIYDNVAAGLRLNGVHDRRVLD